MHFIKVLSLFVFVFFPFPSEAKLNAYFKLAVFPPWNHSCCTVFLIFSTSEDLMCVMIEKRLLDLKVCICWIKFLSTPLLLLNVIPRFLLV
uniref:Secreted protein n=1 Tax=Anguilla anguilla TaxID=7936 RepID=A0A0E9WXT2_ANGAN